MQQYIIYLDEFTLKMKLAAMQNFLSFLLATVC